MSIANDQNQPEKPSGELVPSTSKQWWNLIAVGLKLARDPAGRRGMFILSAVLALLGTLGLIDGTWFALPEISPVDPHQSGWVESVAKVEAPKVAAMMPKFAVRDADGRIVSKRGGFNDLTKYIKAANGGVWPVTPPQETGDCTSFAGTHGMMGLHAMRIKDNPGERLRITFPPVNYNGGRVVSGKNQIRGQGCVMAWVNQGMIAQGMVAWEQAEEMGYPYSGNLAENWGRNPLPPKVAKLAADVRLKSFSRIESWEDFVDSEMNGYPVVFGAPLTFGKRTKEQDNRRWGIQNSRGGHAQVFLAVEDRPGRKAGGFCYGSWGPDAHEHPIDGMPNGGVWVEKEVIERVIIPASDCWALSDTDGFKEDPLADWNAFREKKIEAGETAVVSAAESEPIINVKETRKMYAKPISCSLLGLAGMILTFVLRIKANRACRTAATLLVACSVIGFGATSEAGPKAQARRAARHQAYVVQCSAPCNPASCGCVECQCASQQVAQSPRAREVQTAGRLIASADVPSSWNALSTLTGPPVVSSSWNALRDVPDVKASPPVSQSWNSLASVPPRQPEIKYRRICTGTGCYWVPE